METKKIAIGCFVGGVVGTVIALIFAPLFWWLGMLAGFGAGYLCYDLKEIREKARIAWKKTVKGGTHFIEPLKEPHPFLWPFLALFVTGIYLSYRAFAEKLIKREGPDVLFLCFTLTLFLSLSFAFLLAYGLRLLASIGGRKGKFGENCYLVYDIVFLSFEWKRKNKIEPTYRNVYRLIAKGIFISIYFLVWEMWIIFIKFLWTLFLLIHSRKRLLCGFDTAIGVAISYFWLAPKAVTPEQKILVVIAGGLISATIGALFYELISKRLLHLAPVENKV